MAHPNTRKSAAALVTPCLACNRPTRMDGHCRTRGCPNRFPDPAEAREAALMAARRVAEETRARHAIDRTPILTTQKAPR